MPKPRRAICIYMMKKALFMLAMMACIFASCSDGGSDEPANPTPKPEEVKSEITIDNSIVTNGLSFSVAQGEQSVSFTTNTNWTLSIAATTGGSTWCKASATSGSKGTANVKFTVTENTDYDDRSVSVTIKAGTASKTFTITQKGADALLVTTKKYEVAQAGGKIEVEVKANIEYQIAVSETAKDWIKETQSKSRALTAKKHTFEIAENEEAEKREGEITVKSGDKVETVKVYQAGGAVLLLSKNEFTVSDAGETISVDIKSNVEYGVQMPDVDWIQDEASNRGMSSHTLKYVIAPNEGYDSRSAEIIFYDQNSDLKDTLKVVQAQKDAIVISKKEYEVEAEGETIEVKLSANVDFEVTMPEVDWIEQVESRALTEHTLYFKVMKNEDEESRTAEITIKDKNSDLIEVIIITQKGITTEGYNNGTVTVATAGTMKTLIGNDFLNITSLKVVGPINGTDIYNLRQMMIEGKLHTLDLARASIVEGGNWYYESNNKKYYTLDNIIGNHMFYYCGKLQYLQLPHNITSISQRAFYGCDSLASITIPETVTSIDEGAFMYCRTLTSIEIPKGITTISSDTFYGCKSLTSVTIPEGVTTISESAFSGCSSLTSIIIPETVTSIGGCVFDHCSSLVSINIPDGVTSIGSGIFSDCTSLTSAKIGKGIVKIPSSMFSMCSSLKNVNIPSGIKEIGGGAFSNCTSLTSITIPETVTNIERWAFRACSLRKVYCYATTPPTISSDSFDEISALYVPNKCKEKYEASTWKELYNEIIEME